MQTEACIRYCMHRQSLNDFLPPIEVSRLARASRYETVPAQRLIFRKGDPGDAVMMIDHGQVAIFTASADTRPIMLAVMERGEIFGEISVIDGGDRTANAKAMVETGLVIIEKADFISFLERNPQVCMKLLRLICERLRATDVTVEDIHIFNVRPRLAKRLLSLADHFGITAGNSIVVTVNVAPSQLADMIGTSRSAVTSAFRHWVRHGIIELGAGQFTIRDRTALEAEVGQQFGTRSKRPLSSGPHSDADNNDIV